MLSFCIKPTLGTLTVDEVLYMLVGWCTFLLATHAAACRVLVGVRDKKRKIVTLYPAAGDQVTMLHPRLNAVQYKGVQSDKFPGQAPSERADRYKKKSQLVQAFGSTRRCENCSPQSAPMVAK